MEFNDSHVRDYNFEELKGDCYGGSSGNDDLFGGFFKSSSYGKSAYLLVYEKRFKKPIKVLVPTETSDKKSNQTLSEGLACDDTAKPRCSKHIIPEDATLHTDPKSNEKYYDVPMHGVKLFVPK